MSMHKEELAFVRKMREKCYSGNRVFWGNSGELGVFDPGWARAVNHDNFADLELPDRLVDIIRRRRSASVNWKDLRNAWVGGLKHISGTEGMLALHQRMIDEVGRFADRDVDLNWAIQSITTRSLIPVVISGLPARGFDRVCADQDFKLRRLLQLTPESSGLRTELKSMLIQVRSGLAVRKEIRRRLRAGSVPRGDMTDPVVEMYPTLGMDRAMDAVTTVLTAIAGPPGAAAIGTIFEYTTRPEWAQRIDAELRATDLKTILEQPRKHAPLSLMFIKEVLRLWSPPLFLTRPVRTSLTVCEHALEPGQRYTLSPYLLHHDPDSWADPEMFNPMRWDDDQHHLAATRKGAYCPFGWAPKSCIGASVGTTQQLLWLHLLSTHARLALRESRRPPLKLAAITLPMGFTGRFETRSNNAT